MADSSIIKKLKIVQVIRETDDARTFVLEPIGDWVPVYKAGQFITLVFYTRHGEKRRSYSFSSSPGLNEALSITVKKVDNGEFSRFLIQHAREGDILYSSGISGRFTLPDAIGNKEQFCFIAAGSGIVPCYSLIKALLAGNRNKVVLIYSNKNKAAALFYNSLLELQALYPEKFEIRFLFSDSPDIYNKRLSKWLLEQLLEQYLKKEKTWFYTCGPFEYMQTVEITLLSTTPAERIVKENFSSFPRRVIPKPPDTEPHQVKIHINGTTHILTVQYPKSVLAVAKENGIELPYSCEAGRCSSCVASCTSGKIWMSYNEILSDREVEKGRVLVCQSFPVEGDAEIVYN